MIDIDWSAVKSVTIPQGDVKKIDVDGVTVWEKASSILPSEYQQVEYIESTDDRTQYIDTGIVPTVDLPFSCTFISYYSSAPGYGNVFGSRRASQNNEYQLSAYSNGTVSVGRRNTSLGISAGTLYTVEFDGDSTVTINGTDKTINIGDLSNNSYPIHLFGLDQANWNCQREHVRLYSCTFGDLRNFIPCYRIEDGEIGMYDTVSQTFFTNAGSGTFTKGADVS